MSETRRIYTELCHSTVDRITVRGVDLCSELIGKVSFTEMMFFDILGRRPTLAETRIVDAVLVTLMEHGLAPSAIAARLTYSGAPEALQGAVAAGLLGGGSALLGTLESSARLLNKLVVDPAGVEAAARREAESCRATATAVPGFGHPYHKPDDPRTATLFRLARSLGVPGKHIEACEILSSAVDAAFGKHLVINASAACGALLCEIGVPVDIARGFALVSRSAGLVAHVYEESKRPIIWSTLKAVGDAVPYVGPDGTPAGKWA